MQYLAPSSGKQIAQNASSDRTKEVAGLSNSLFLCIDMIYIAYNQSVECVYARVIHVRACLFVQHPDSIISCVFPVPRVILLRLH